MVKNKVTSKSELEKITQPPHHLPRKMNLKDSSHLHAEKISSPPQSHCLSKLLLLYMTHG